MDDYCPSPDSNENPVIASNEAISSSLRKVATNYFVSRIDEARNDRLGMDSGK